MAEGAVNPLLKSEALGESRMEEEAKWKVKRPEVTKVGMTVLLSAIKGGKMDAHFFHFCLQYLFKYLTNIFSRCAIKKKRRVLCIRGTIMSNKWGPVIFAGGSLPHLRPPTSSTSGLCCQACHGSWPFHYTPFLPIAAAAGSNAAPNFFLLHHHWAFHGSQPPHS